MNAPKKIIWSLSVKMNQCSNFTLMTRPENRVGYLKFWLVFAFDCS